MSKVFKCGAGAEIVPLDLAGDLSPTDSEVRPYRFRQVIAPRHSRAGGDRAGPAEQGAPAPPPVDLDAIRESAYQQGYGAGEQAGAEKAARQFESVMQAFRKTIEELAAYKPALRAEAEQELVKLALVIARRIIHREVQVDRSSVVGIARACIAQINGAEIHRLRVNPADAEVVARYFRDSDYSDMEIVPDQSIAPGGAILHTSQGQLDAQLETQLREIEYGLADR